ncbi:MAG: two-component system response regulator, partial [Bacteroidetes bacterium 4572_112]
MGVMDDFKVKPVIVVIDDELIILNSIRSLLRRQFAVHTFINPAEVKSFLNDHHVDLVISDEMMPEIKGSELMTEIHKTHPSICKIILSGHAEKENIAAAINNAHIFAFLF